MSDSHLLDSLGIHLHTDPSNPNMRQLDERKRSFHINSWNVNIPVTVDKLAEAGFYYTGYKDYVLCFYYSGGICDWELGDDVWIAHSKYFSDCPFVKIYKSQSFIEKCKKLNHTRMESDDVIVIDQIIDVWLKDYIVQQLISLNLFSTALIRATLEKRYLASKKPFETFTELY